MYEIEHILINLHLLNLLTQHCFSQGMLSEHKYNITKHGYLSIFVYTCYKTESRRAFACRYVRDKLKHS